MPDGCEAVVSTRRQAIAAGAAQYFTGKPCPHGHIAMRRVTGACCACAAGHSARWQRENAERLRPQKAANERKHRDTANARKRRWYAAHCEQSKVATARWASAHSAQVNARSAKRRAAKLRSSPRWANTQSIARVYQRAADMRNSGLDVHVDHIIPLQGETVCGLHVHDNLQIISGTANRAKSNFF